MNITTEPKRKNCKKINLVLTASTIGILASACAVYWIGSGHQPWSERLISEMVSGERAPDLELLRQMGPKAIPPLRKALTKQDSVPERAYAFLRPVLPESFCDYLPQPMSSQVSRLNAAALVGYLGPAAKPVLPELINLLKDD